MSRARIGCITIVLLVGIAGSAWIASHATLWSRIATYPTGREVTAVARYEPRESIRGAFETPLPTTDAAAVGMDPVALATAADLANELDSSAFLVLRDGQVVLERYWRGCGPDVPTNSFSMAKSLVALLFGVAIARGEIEGLDDPIARYVDEWRGEARGAITLRDLLTMQSGLQYDDDRNDRFSALVQLHLAADLLPAVLTQRPSRPPGSDWDNNNLNAQLLALALERASGARFAELLAARLWRPIGARDASVWLDREGGTAKAYGCVFATARDWARVGELVRQRGRVGEDQVVPATWFDAMETPATHNPRYGLHVWLHPRAVYLDGKSKQRVFVLRDERVVVVRTGENTSGWSNDRVLASVLGAIVE